MLVSYIISFLFKELGAPWKNFLLNTKKGSNLKHLNDRYKKHDRTYRMSSCDCVLCNVGSSCHGSSSLDFSEQMACQSSGYDWGGSWRHSDNCLSKSICTHAGLDTVCHCDSGLCCSICRPASGSQTTSKNFNKHYHNRYFRYCQIPDNQRSEFMLLSLVAKGPCALPIMRLLDCKCTCFLNKTKQNKFLSSLSPIWICLRIQSTAHKLAH